jgi:hypothetical protein
MQRREAVQRAMRGHAISQRRACVLVGVDPKTVRRERSPSVSQTAAGRAHQTHDGQREREKLTITTTTQRANQ